MSGAQAAIMLEGEMWSMQVSSSRTRDVGMRQRRGEAIAVQATRRCRGGEDGQGHGVRIAWNAFLEILHG